MNDNICQTEKNFFSFLKAKVDFLQHHFGNN